MPRQPRDARRPRVHVRLSGRDAALLRALGRFRIARTSDLVRLAFGGVRRDTAAARLRKLFDAGYLAVRSGGQAEESLYSLGPQGKRWLRGQDREPGPVPRGGLDHHLAIVRTWIDLAVAVRELPGLRLVSARPDWELRRETAGEYRMVSDLLVRLAVETGNEPTGVSLAVEVDRGTEPLWVLRGKLERYGSETGGAAGDPEFAFAVVLTRESDQRRRGIEELLRRTWLGSGFVWAIDSGPASALMRLCGNPEAPLTESPHGKGRGAAVSRVPSRTLPVRGEGL